MDAVIDCTFQLVTPVPGRSGAAIAMIALAGDVDAAWAALGWKAIEPGAVRRRDLSRIDGVVVARFGPRHGAIFPHAGPAVLRAVLNGLEAAGLRRAERGLPARDSYPEARDDLEAKMLDALARAASALAVDLLLDQPRRWRDVPADGDLAARSGRLNRLIDPPLVAILGRPNIGKSTLLNALAGEPAARVADEPGTTRDHVGVTLDLGGVVVHYLDTPGIFDPGDPRAGPLDREAAGLALAAAAHADLLLLARDPGTAWIEPATLGLPTATPVLRLLLRADLRAGHDGEADGLAVSVHTGQGLAALVEALGERLVPRADREHPGRWRFWPDCGADGRAGVP